MKWIVLFVILLTVTVVRPVAAQAPHACGTTYNFSVIFDRVDAAGYAPRFKEGNQPQFDCISARDPQFAVQRFPSTWQALDYWFTLYGQELGVNLQPLPAPSN